jgi:diaminopimelate decarboxylase
MMPRLLRSVLSVPEHARRGNFPGFSGAAGAAVHSPAVIRPPSFVYRSAQRNRPGRAEQELHCDALSLSRLAARAGTPLYVYSAAAIRARLRAFDAAFRGIPHTLCYSVKANSSLAVLRLVARAGHGFDVVSGGELERVLRARPRAARKVVFSGVGKSREEMALALRSDILLFNVESASELGALAETAASLRRRARIAIRVNPDLRANTHPYISTGLRHHKFGVPIAEAERLYKEAARNPNLRVAGVSVHIGSQIADVGSFRAALARVASLVLRLRRAGHSIRYVDAGGGLAIPYKGGRHDFRRQFAAYARAVTGPLRSLGVHLLLEPGRSIVGPAGVLLTRVLYRKTNHGKRFLIVDAAMNDLLRPALYGARHEIVPVSLVPSATRRSEKTDVAGPICETGDFFAHGIHLPAVSEGALLAILDTGAYAASLGSNFNSRSKPAEVLVDGSAARTIRRRERPADLMRLESP